MYYFRIALPIACASPSSREASDFSNAVHCFVATLLLLYNSFLCAVFLCSARLSFFPPFLARNGKKEKHEIHFSAILVINNYRNLKHILEN